MVFSRMKKNREGLSTCVLPGGGSGETLAAAPSPPLIQPPAAAGGRCWAKPYMVDGGRWVLTTAVGPVEPRVSRSVCLCPRARRMTMAQRVAHRQASQQDSSRGPLSRHPEQT